MSFTRSTTNTSVHQGMPDYPSSQGYTTTQLKQAFDAPAEGLQQDLNGLCTELEDTSAAGNIGATPLDAGDSSNGTVQDKLDYIQSELQGISMGGIIDGSVTQTKLDPTYEATLAKKDGTLQTGLDAEMLNSKTEAQLKTAFLATPDPSVLSFTGLAAPGTNGTSQTATETKTYSSNGSRYYMIISSYADCTLLLYDAKTQKFVFGNYVGRNVDDSKSVYASNTANIKLLNNGNNDSNVTLAVTYSSGTLTFNVTKQSYKTSGGTSKSVPAGTLTVFELGAMA